MQLKSIGPMVNEFHVLIKSCLYKNSFAYEHMSSFATKALSCTTRVHIMGCPVYGLSSLLHKSVAEVKAATRINF